MATDLKRYPPTTLRLQRLREAGLVPHSPALTALGALVGAGLVAWLLWPTWQAEVREFAATCWSSHNLREPAVAQARCSAALLLTLKWGATVGLAGAGAGWLAHLAQTGFAWGSVLNRGKRRGLPSPRPSVGREVCLAGLSLLVVGLSLARVLQTLAEPSGGAGDLAARCAWAALTVALPGLVGVALVDLAWRRAQFIQSAWMTEIEMRDELRETESAWRRHTPVSEARPHE